MGKQKEKELERAARLEKHRQEAEDARAAYRRELVRSTRPGSGR